MRGKFSHMGKRVLSLLLIFLISLIGFDLLAINGSITAVSEGTIFEPSFSIYPLPSYKEYLNRHGTVKNVTISEYNSKYGTASQYGSDYKIRIDNAEQLFLFSKLSNDLATRHHFLTLNYILGNNIDYENYFKNTNNYFVPIGRGSLNDAGDTPFTGSFDGQGFEISNIMLAIDVDTVNTNRLFAFFGSNKGVIRNFGLINPIINTQSVVGDVYTSGIAGKNLSGGLIEFVYVSDNRTDSPGYKGENSIFSGLVSLNQSGATISNAYYSGIVADSAYYMAGNIRPAIMMNYGTITEVYYNKSKYLTQSVPLHQIVVANSSKTYVTLSAAVADTLSVGQKINIGKFPYSNDVATEKVITSITVNGSNKNVNFSGGVTTAIGNYVWVTNNVDSIDPNPNGSGTVTGVYAADLEGRKNCLTNENWRTHAYEAIATAGLELLRATPKLQGFSGYASSNWGAASYPLEILTPADLVYFSKFFSTKDTTVTSRVYHVGACIDMSTVAADAYYFTQFPEVAKNFDFSGTSDGGEACSHRHYKTIEDSNPNHAIINLSMTKSANGAVQSGSTILFNNADAIGFIPSTSIGTGTIIKNLNFIGGDVKPVINSSSNMLVAGSITGFGLIPLNNVHSSMDVIISDGAVSPFYAGGITGYSAMGSATNISFSGMLSGGAHPYDASKAPSRNYSVGGICGALHATGPSFTNILSHGLIEAPGFYNVPLTSGKYDSNDIQTLAGGVFGGTVIYAQAQTLVNKSDIYTVPMNHSGSAPTARTGPSGQRVYAISTSAGGIFSFGAQPDEVTPTMPNRLINYGNIFGTNLIGRSSVAGLVGTHYRVSHGWKIQNAANYGNITVSDSDGAVFASGIQNRMINGVSNSFISIYNFGNIEVKSNNRLDNCLVGGISALAGTTTGDVVPISVSNNVYNYGKINVDIVSDSCNLYVGGITAVSSAFSSSALFSTIQNHGDISVSTTQSAGDLKVCGLTQTSVENSVNMGNISVNATGNMSNVIHVGGVTYLTTTAKTYKNIINAGNIRVNANTSDQILAGGFFSNVGGVTAVNTCLNIGDISVKNSGAAAVGGIGGYLSTSSVNNQIIDCINSGNITVEAGGNSLTTAVGGIMGYADVKFRIQNCLNYGNISSTVTNEGAFRQYTGGIFGQLSPALASSEYVTAAVKGHINFGNITVNAPSANHSSVSSGGIVGLYSPKNALLMLLNLINNGEVRQNVGSNFGAIAGSMQLYADATLSASGQTFANHLNTVAGLKMYGECTKLRDATSLTRLTIKNLITVNSGDPYINGTSVYTAPLQGTVTHQTNDIDGIYSSDFIFNTDSANDSFIYTPFDSLALARKDNFPDGMYALTINTGFLSKIYLPETLHTDFIDGISIDFEQNAANKKDKSWRTDERKDFDGTVMFEASVNERYEFVKQVDNDPVIITMTLESAPMVECSDCKSRLQTEHYYKPEYYYRSGFRFRADDIITQHGGNPEAMTNDEMTAYIKDKKVACPSCGKVKLGSVFSENTFDYIQRRDDEENILYFYTTENLLGNEYRIKSYTSNMGTVYSTLDGDSYRLARFFVPEVYNGSIDPETINVDEKVYLVMPEGSEFDPIEYTVKLVFIPNPKMSLTSVSQSTEEGGLSAGKSTPVAGLQKDGETHIVPEAVYYGGTNHSPLLLFGLKTENLSAGFLQQDYATITFDETGEDFTGKFIFSQVTDYWNSTFIEKSDPPQYLSGTSKTGPASDNPGNTRIYTKANDLSFPEGWYTLRLTVNGNVLLSLRFRRNINRVGFPEPSTFYTIDKLTKTVVRNDSPYGLSSEPRYFYPFGSTQRAYDVMLYPTTGDKGGAVCAEGDRLLTDVRLNPDGTHTYTNKVSYIPEIGVQNTTWWTVTTNEGLTGKLAVQNLKLNGEMQGDGTDFLVVTSNETRDNVVVFEGVYTVIDLALENNIKFGVQYTIGGTTVDLTKVEGSSDYAPRFSMGGNTILSIDQSKITSSNSAHNTLESITPNGTYEYTATLTKDAPFGKYEVYFIYDREQTVMLSTFDEETTEFVKNSDSTLVHWNYTFPTPLTINKALNSDSYLKEAAMSGILYEKMQCITPGHTHDNVISFDNSIINYASTVMTGENRDTHFRLNMYFPAGVNIEGRSMYLKTALGATIYRKTGDYWVIVESRHTADYIINGEYEYMIVSEDGQNKTYYTISPKEEERNKRLNIEAVEGNGIINKEEGITDLQSFYEKKADRDLFITVNQIIFDEDGNSQVYETYNASFLGNNGMHLPYEFPLVSYGTYILDVSTPDGYDFDLYYGDSIKTLRDNRISGIKFTLDQTVSDKQQINLTIKIKRKTETPLSIWGIFKIWFSHNDYNGVTKPTVTTTEFDVVFDTSGWLFNDIKPENHTNVIISPRKIKESEAPGTCFTQGTVTVPEGVTIIGDIFARKDVYIYGTVIGNVHTEGNVYGSGKVEGKIY